MLVVSLSSLYVIFHMRHVFRCDGTPFVCYFLVLQTFYLCTAWLFPHAPTTCGDCTANTGWRVRSCLYWRLRRSRLLAHYLNRFVKESMINWIAASANGTVFQIDVATVAYIIERWWIWWIGSVNGCFFSSCRM